jgi:mannose-6-phosphate isomerase-like protein (cupin superfamily)
MATTVKLEDALAKTTFLENRTIHTDTTGYFARIADYRDGGISAAGFSGISQWERHPVGDEVVQILDGACTLTLRGPDGEEAVELSAGMLAVVPRGVWHQFHAPEGVTIMTTTPQPTEHITDAEPPATA